MTAAEAVFARSQVRLIEDSAEALRSDPLDERRVQLLERIIAQATGLIEELEVQFRQSWQALMKSPHDYPAQKTGEIYAMLFDHLFLAFQAVDRLTRAAKTDGYTDHSIETFRNCLQKAHDLHERFREGWPMLDIAEAEAASARILAGQYVSLEGLARALDIAD